MRVHRLLAPCLAGAVLAFTPVLTAESQAGMVENAQKLLRAGECKWVGGANRGRLCLVRVPSNSPYYVRFFITFDGLWTHMNFMSHVGQIELPRSDRNQTRILSRSAKPGQIVEIRVQACNKPFVFSSRCTQWTTLHIMR